MSNAAATKKRVFRQLRMRENYPEATLIEVENEILEEYTEALRGSNFRRAMSRVDDFTSGVPMNRGMSQLLAGDPTGWQNIERGWVIRTMTIHALRPHAGEPAAELLAHAMVIGDSEIAGWMADQTEQRLAEGDDEWKGRRFPPFALALYRRWRDGREFEGVSGVYEEIGRAWNGEGLVQALDAACEYRLDDVCDDEKLRPEFLTYDLIPIDLAAIRVVREREGLSTPEPTHPLAHTPLAAVPTGRTGYDPATDPWVQRALDAARPEGLLPRDWSPKS